MDEWSHRAQKTFRILVPAQGDRVPATWQALPYAILFWLPYLFMAFLARRPGTRTIRLLYLPVVILFTVRIAYGFTWTQPKLNVYNWAHGLLAGIVIAKTISFAVAPEGMLRHGESRPGETHLKKDVPNGIPNGVHVKSHMTNGASPAPKAPSNRELLIWLLDAIDLMCDLRGIRWNFGNGVYIATEKRPVARSRFLRATLVSCLQSLLTLDLIEFVIKSFPGVGAPDGGSIFYENLPPLQRYAISTFLHFLTGWGILLGFTMTYDLFTLIGVAIFKQEPTSWPPVFDNPWISDSLHVFWARRWHQVLRHIFLTYGGWPGYLIAGNLGMVLGTFFASGLFHECAMYGMGRGFEWKVPLFFLLQGPLLLLERIFSRVFKTRVGGTYGIIWVYFCIGVLGQPLTDSWHKRGLAGGQVIPPFISPTQYLLQPIAVRMLR